VVGYILGFIAIFNMKHILAVGHYQGTYTTSVSVGEGTGGITVDMYAYHQREYTHHIGYTITTFSKGDIDLIGISKVDYRLDASVILIQSMDEIYTDPINTISYQGYRNLVPNLNLTIEGSLDLIFNVNGIYEPHTLHIELGLFIYLDGMAIHYEWGNISTWLNVIYLSFTVIPLAFLYRNIKMYKFEKWYSQELRERDENFYRILSKQSKE